MEKHIKYGSFCWLSSKNNLWPAQFTLSFESKRVEEKEEGVIIPGVILVLNVASWPYCLACMHANQAHSP